MLNKKLLQLFEKSYIFAHTLLTDIISPPLCFFCRDFMDKRKVLCDNCLRHIFPIVSHTIEITKKYPVKVFAISDYKDPIRSLILSKGSSDIVTCRKLGQLIWDHTYIKHVEFDFVVAIPLHIKRFASRGFNQAQEIANVIGAQNGKRVVNILNRNKNTVRQSDLSVEKRYNNVQNAFCLNIKNVDSYKGKNLLIVDDLMTTGSTIKAAARKLSQLKPKTITAVVACRVV